MDVTCVLYVFIYIYKSIHITTRNVHFLKASVRFKVFMVFERNHRLTTTFTWAVTMCCVCIILFRNWVCFLLSTNWVTEANFPDWRTSSDGSLYPWLNADCNIVVIILVIFKLHRKNDPKSNASSSQRKQWNCGLSLFW